MRFFLIPLAGAALLLAACAQPIFDAETGEVGLSVAPLASLPRVQQGEEALRESIETVISDEDRAKLDTAFATLDAQDKATSDWLYYALGALGIGGVGYGVTRRKASGGTAS